MSDSISFDRAADIYDATRALRPEAQAQVTDAMLGELRRLGAGRVLEIGVGTGRMARPLAERGIRVCGVDISPRMLARLRDQLGPQHTPPDLMLADATHLPIRARSFRAALAVHVFHLIPGWRAALRELQRVIEPGGVLIEHYEDSDFGALESGNQKWSELLAARGFERRQRPDPEEIDEALEEMGATVCVETVCEENEMRTPAQDLEETRARVHSWTWEIPDGVLQACLPEYERWARDFFRDLHRPFTGRVRHQLEVWTFP
jgi:ubiquinone/menaquinone biosynthesis C-methylase UbiE